MSFAFLDLATIVAVCDNRAQFFNGGNYGQRTFRPATGDQMASGGSVCGRDLWAAGTQPRLVSPVVASLSNVWPQWAVRSDTRQRATEADLTQTGTNHCRNSAATGFPDTSRYPLQPHWGQFDSSRIAGLAHPSFTQRADGGASAGTQRRNDAPGATGSLPGSQHLS